MAENNHDVTNQDDEGIMFDWSNYNEAIKVHLDAVEKYDAKYAKTTSDTITWKQGKYARYEQIEQGIRIHFTHESDTWTVDYLWLAVDCVHVVGRTSHSYAVIKPDSEWNAIKLNIHENEQKITIEADDTYHYFFDKATGTLHAEVDGLEVYREASSLGWGDNEQIAHELLLHESEASYGAGERAFNLNLRGREYTFWNTDSGGYSRGEEPINYSIPMHVNVHDMGLFGIFWDNSARGTIKIGINSSDKMRFEFEMGQISYYIFTGQSLDSILERYTDLTGRMPMPPLWALGYHQSRYSYMNTKDVLDTARKMRELNIPCDAIYLDIHYMVGYRVFTWDKERFEDLADMIVQLHEMGIRLVTIVDPGVKIDEDYIGYQSGMENEVFMTYPDGEPVAGVVWPGLTHFPDFSDEKARNWWAEMLTPLLDTGVDGLWNDMNEPLFFGKGGATYPADYALMSIEGKGGTHQEFHNIYGMMMGKATLSALEKHRAGKRQFNIIRAGYAGAQRYASSWTADNRATWDDLYLSIAVTLNKAISGQSFTGPDIGGFIDDTTGELLVRWLQAGAFLPFYRNHSAVDTIRQEPWLFGDDYLDAGRKAIQLRYKLMPYLYDAFAKCHQFGYPIVAPLWILAPQNPVVREIDDCYLIGRDILVAPIVQQDSLRRQVYLPDGNWYDYHSREMHVGEQWIMTEAPLDHLPLFVRAGRIIAEWDVLDDLRQKTDTLRLYVYAGNGQTVIYDDAGEGLECNEGDYAWHGFEMQQRGQTLMIQHHTVGKYQTNYERIELHFIGLDSVDEVTIDGHKQIVVNNMVGLVDFDFSEIKVN